jgi:hypothetical protein
MTQFILKEVFNNSQMLKSLEIVVLVHLFSISVLGLELFPDYKVLPDSDNFMVESFGFLDGVFFLKELSHIEVAATEIYAFRSVLLAL